jgi:[acyl-carrier-protein] S-malonyltransferase
MIRGLPESVVARDGGQPTDPVQTLEQDIVAVVADRPITRAALDARVAAVRRGPRGKHLPPDIGTHATTTIGRWIVQELVTEALLEHEIRAAGLGELTPDAAVALVERVTADVSVPEAQIRGYYDRNDDRYRRADNAGLVPYERARPGIEAELLAGARARAFGEWLELRRQALVTVDPAWAHPGDPAHGLPSHRH